MSSLKTVLPRVSKSVNRMQPNGMQVSKANDGGWALRSALFSQTQLLHPCTFLHHIKNNSLTISSQDSPASSELSPLELACQKFHSSSTIIVCEKELVA